jgi:hypothetical protein
MDRRTFLSIAAGSPLLFGLRELLAQETEPDFIARALKRMKETRRWGVFLVIPEAEAARRALGQGLLDQMPTGSKRGRQGFELFTAHVFVCLSADQAGKLGMGLKRGPDGVIRLLVNSEGKQIAADRVPLEVFEDSAKFIPSFKTFIHGADGARLRDHAQEIAKSLDEKVKKAAEGRSGDDIATLTAAADAIAPWLLQKSVENPEGVFDDVLWNYYVRQSLQNPEPALPFGLKVERGVVEDPCPPCGMAAYRPAAYKFISFYAK